MSRECLWTTSCAAPHPANPNSSCGGRHHLYLHGTDFQLAKDDLKRYKQERRDAAAAAANASLNAAVVNDDYDDEDDDNSRSNCAVCTRDGYVTLPIEQAWVVSPNKRSLEYVALDTMSQGTFVDAAVVAEHGLEGPDIRSTIKTMTDAPSYSTKALNFTIESCDGQVVYDLNEIEMLPRIDIVRPNINWKELEEKWPHLHRIPLPRREKAKVTVLIGFDVPDALKVLETRNAPPDKPEAPRADRYSLGWTIVGPLNGKAAGKRRINALVLNTADAGEPGGEEKEQEDDAEEIEKRCTLVELFRKFCNNESFGTTPGLPPPVPRADVKALAMFRKSIVHTGERYQIGLPWKPGQPNIKDNSSAARHRFNSLQCRFRRDDAYYRSYAKDFDQYTALGFSHEFSPEEFRNTKPNRSNFLTHHGVTHPAKPGKVRTVFHANEVNGDYSLNERLYRGPDFLNSLPSVLNGFRKRLFAVSGDIEKMFLQVLVAPEDAVAFRYWWLPYGQTGQPRMFQMDRVIFGAICSPSLCSYVMRRTAEDNEADFPDLVDRVHNQYYADNYLDSFDEEAEAVDVCKRMVTLMKRGGFPLKQWSSNSRAVMEVFSGDQNAHPQLDLSLDKLPTERILGVDWNCETDFLLFPVKIPTEEVQTRREMLSMTASIYDPCGFLSPFIIIPKLILRDSHRCAVEWDTPLDKELIKRWSKWSATLPSLKELRIPRCIRPDRRQPSNVQLHAFSDASSTAFGAGVYLRFGYEDGSVHVSFLISKSKVASLQANTIPRLELNGCLVAHRLVKQMIKDFNLVGVEVTFWSDSKTCLSWIHSETCRFEIYVGNRITEINTPIPGAGARHWRYISSKENPADDCTRGLKTLKFEHRWYQGPSIIYQSPSTWPPTPDDCLIEPTTADKEVRSTGWVLATRKERPCIIDQYLTEYFKTESDLARLERAMGWLARFINEFVRTRRLEGCSRSRPYQKRKTQFHIERDGFLVPVQFKQPVEKKMSDQPQFVPGPIKRRRALVLPPPAEGWKECPLGKAVRTPKSSVEKKDYSKETVQNKSSLKIFKNPELEKKIVSVTQRSQPPVKEKVTPTSSVLNLNVPFEEEAVQVTPLTLEEMEQGRRMLIRAAQRAGYAEEINDLRSGKPVKKTSDIRSLSPCLDEYGVMRAKGRLEHAALPHSARHPYILPPDHPLTGLIVRRVHQQNHHLAVHQTWAQIRKECYFVRGKQVVRGFIHDCFACRVRDARPRVPEMAPLPPCRVQAPDYPFQHSGLDCFGPYNITIGRSTVKKYGILFTCMASRAVYVDYLDSMDTGSFVMAFRRFYSQRGPPQHIYSDNGTNFVAGDKEINEGIGRWNNFRISKEMAEKKVQWHFNPPGAPHFGGVWERLVRSIKFGLFATFHHRTCSEEVFRTVLKEVEKILNNRPLTSLSADPRDPEPLTPNHILRPFVPPGRSSDCPDFNSADAQRLHRQAQGLANDFWDYWLLSYIPELIERRKWTDQRLNLRTGDVVAIVDDNQVRDHWTYGRVVNAEPGADGVVRVVQVRIQGKVQLKPVSRVCLLEADASSLEK